MNQVISNIVEAERGGLIDLGKALRYLLSFGGGGGTAIQEASYADFRAGTATDRYISPASFFAANAAYTLTDTDDIIVNMNNGINFLLTIAGDRNVPNPLNPKVGQEGVIVIQQDAVGGRTLTWGTDWKFIGGTAPALPSAAHAWTLLRYYVQAETVIRATVEATSSAALNAATVQELWTGLESLKYISPNVLIDSEAPVALVEASPVLVDLGEGKNFTLTLTADRTIDSPLDQMPGRTGSITVRQDGTGGWTLGWHVDWKFTDTTPTLRSSASAATIFRYRVEDVGIIHVTKEPDSATVSDYFIGTSTDKFISPYAAFEGYGAFVLTDGATITPDLSQGLIFSLTLGGNRTISNPINQKKQSGLFYIRQDSTGDRTLSWDTNFQFVGGVIPTIPTAPSAWTVVPYQVLEPGTILCTAVDAPAVSGGGGTSVDAASAIETKAGLVSTKYISPLTLSGFFAPVVLVDSAVIAPDMAAGSNFIVTLGGNRTMANILNQKPGRSGLFIIIQDGVGGRSLTWGDNYTFLGGIPVLPSAPGGWTVLPYFIQDFGIIRCASVQTSVIPAAASVAEARAGTITNKYISPSVAVAANAFVSLTDQATVTLDLQSGINFKLVLGGNRSMANPTNQAAGQQGLIKIQQDPTGGRTLAWGSEYIFETVAPVIPVDPNKHIIVPYNVESPGVVLMGN